jgi:glycosyltransferase involved in cell wall biosynthesis
MESSPLVSVVVVCCNQEQFINEAIESVIKQTYVNFECLIVDDGSTDRTASICKQYVEQDKRIHYFHQENSGVSAARNLGFSLSKGVYVQFLDGDDYLLPEKIGIQVELMKRDETCDVSYTNHKYYWQHFNTFAQYTFEELGIDPLLQLLFKYDRGVSIPIHSALLRKSIWTSDELPFPSDYKYRYEDWVFWILIALRRNRFRFINMDLVVYRMHGRNFVENVENVAFHSLQAIIYLSKIIPGEHVSRFQEERVLHVVDKYFLHHRKGSMLKKRTLWTVIRFKSIIRKVMNLRGSGVFR